MINGHDIFEENLAMYIPEFNVLLPPDPEIPLLNDREGAAL